MVYLLLASTLYSFLLLCTCQLQAMDSVLCGSVDLFFDVPNSTKQFLTDSIYLYIVGLHFTYLKKHVCVLDVRV